MTWHLDIGEVLDECEEIIDLYDVLPSALIDELERKEKEDYERELGRKTKVRSKKTKTYYEN